MIGELIKKYRDVVSYLFFGVCTTAVNVFTFWFCAHPLRFDTMFSTVLAWIAAVLFAYITNRKWVFHSKASGASEIRREIISFFSCRLATGIVDWLLMLVFVEWLNINDVFIKVTANIVVIILNFVASKLIIFKSK